MHSSHGVPRPTRQRPRPTGCSGQPARRTASTWRGGDGHETATFTITRVRGGAAPALFALSDTAGLVRRQYAADYGSSSSSADVSVSLEHTAPGGVDLLPLPGRYLTAPTDQPTVHLRLGAQTSARCAAPNWKALHLGCYAASRVVDSYVGTAGATVNRTSGMSLERCALHCATHAPTAVALAAQETSAPALRCPRCRRRARRPPLSACYATCSAEDEVEGSQLCGAPDGHANLYTLPSSLSTTGNALPCSFGFASQQTAQLTALSLSVAAANATLVLTGSGFTSGTGAPTVDVCGGRLCVVASYNDTNITCTMPDCPERNSAAALVHVPLHTPHKMAR